MLARAKEFLGRKSIPEPRLEAELLVAHALGLDRLGLFLQLDRPVSAGEVERARALLLRRGKREPLAYITGRREFYGRVFELDRAVLIPRPETELLVDVARARLQPGARIADFGTGSGCLAVTLALEIEGARIHAVEVSPAALDCARRNAQRLGATLTFIEADSPNALGTAAPFDCIVSNPPYIAPHEREELAPEVRDWEPALALFTPPGDPVHWLWRLLDAGNTLLAPGGSLLIELGAAQAEIALQMARERGYDARTHRDLAGIERVLDARPSSRPTASA